MARRQKLIIDCQVFQYRAWSRGMGRYTLKLIEALGKEDIDLTLLFNERIDLSKHRVKEIRAACPHATFLKIKLPDEPSKYGGWLELQKECTAVLDKQLIGLLGPADTYLIASNFSLRYCSAFPSLDCNKAIVFYDLTPYIEWGSYRTTPDFEPHKYFAQFETVFKADQIWAISQSAGDEAKFLLGIDAEVVHNIRGASIRRETTLRHAVPPEGVTEGSDFVLCSSSDSSNKNNENAVRAFEEFNKKHHNKYTLVITSDFSNDSKTMFRDISDNLLFTGHVSDQELTWLYRHCSALLFVSIREGLGLPILEAVEAGKKVICSDIEVFTEISDKAFYFANPWDVLSIAKALTDALILASEWDNKKKLYVDINKIFSWSATANTCVQLLKQPHQNSALDQSSKQRIIYYADSDHNSLPRDIAEILYPMRKKDTFVAMRDFTYKYKHPSYLIEMGVAKNALARQIVTHQQALQVYLLDDSLEAARLLLYALKQPGLIVLTFGTAKPPTKIESYFSNLLGQRIEFERILELARKVGNRSMVYDRHSKRGTPRFIEELKTLQKSIKQEKAR